jgi:hypothetical protein
LNAPAREACCLVPLIPAAWRSCTERQRSRISDDLLDETPSVATVFSNRFHLCTQDVHCCIKRDRVMRPTALQESLFRASNSSELRFKVRSQVEKGQRQSRGAVVNSI